MRRSIAGLGLVVVLLGAGWAPPVDEIPAPFAPFEHMVGAWKGTATPVANRVKGWTESHAWAWKFEKGKPVAMTVDWQGDKTLTKGQLTFDGAEKKYRLDGADAAGKPVVFVGAISPDGKQLTLDRVVAAKADKERIIVRPNANKIRYTIQVDRQEAGAPQYKKQIEVGLTKAGESFAAGSGGENLPKCIMTGGASTMTVSYQGKTYPVCCTGCRDEFNDNPEKYVKKAEEAAKAGPASARPGDRPTAASKGKDDGSFDGLFDEAKPKSKPR